jgi:hypothetical protein
MRVAGQTFRFVSRAEQLPLRGQRNYSRYMQLTKGFVAAEGPERRQWQKESAQESVHDAEWNQHHGPVSKLLGHSSIKITERHYAPWVKARQDQLEADVRRIWT